MSVISYVFRTPLHEVQKLLKGEMSLSQLSKIPVDSSELLPAKESSDTVSITPEAQKAYDTRQYFNAKFAEADQKVPVEPVDRFFAETLYGEAARQYRGGNVFVAEMTGFSAHIGSMLGTVSSQQEGIQGAEQRLSHSKPEDSGLWKQSIQDQKEWLDYTKSHVTERLGYLKSYSEQHGVEEEAKAFFNEYLSMMHGKSVDLTSLYREYGSA